MNLFDSDNYPESEPTELTVGDRWAWKRSDLTDYDNSLHTLTYSARLEASGSTEIEITASASGTDYLVEIPAATTSTYSKGKYHWQAYITRISDSERVTIESGSFSLTNNNELSNIDPRSHAKVVLEAIEATIERRATKDQQSYTINGRTLARTPIEELMVLRDRYRDEVRQEETKEKLANGMGDPRMIGIRLRRV